MRKITSTNGLTLVELVTVIVIIGIIIGIGVSRFNSYVARARQAEAKTNLGTLWGLNETYKLEHGSYTDLPSDGIGEAGEECDVGTQIKNKLGFRPVDCDKLRYLYEGMANKGRFSAHGKGASKDTRIYPGCTADDVWHMEQKRKRLTNKKDSDGKNIFDHCE